MLDLRFSGRIIAARSCGLRHVLILALLLALFALLLFGAHELSYTADEPAYVAGGYAVLVTGARALPMLAQRGYPPLLPAIHALLHYLGEPRIPVTQLEGWPDYYDVFSNAFVDVLRADPSGLRLTRAILISRLSSIWLAVLLAALLVRWGSAIWTRKPWGRWVGPGILLLLIVDPTFLAHGRLATTDLGVTAFGTAALYVTCQWARIGSRRSGWGHVLAAGILLAAAMLSKVSGPLWALCCGLTMVAGLFCRRCHAWRRDVVQIAAVTAISLALVWAAYGFSLGQVGDLAVRVPAPDYWTSALYLTSYNSTFFALGERYTGSRWWYFPLAFVIKNPLPLLVAWALGGAVLVRVWLQGRDRRSGLCARLSFLALVLFPCVYGVVALGSGMNIGYRHLLPLHPLLHLLAAGGLVRLWHSVGATRAGSAPARVGRLLWRGGMLVLWVATAVATLHLTPNELAFFSILVGGPRSGYKYLVDSNLDWGQRNNLLDAYLTTHPEVQHAPSETPFQPAPGRYIVGASELHGVGIGETYGYEWFRHAIPSGNLDYSFLIYDVPQQAIAWIAQCQSPMLPLDAAAIEAGLGAERTAKIRQLGFDCTQSWLYPDGGSTPGLYAISMNLLQQGERAFASLLLRPPEPRDAFVGEKLALANLSFLDESQGFALQVFAPPDVDEDGIGAGLVTGAFVSGGVPSAEAFERCDPYVVDGPLTFVGASVTERDVSVDVETWWRVVEGPIARNFSIAAHLLTAEGTMLAGADGLGVWPMVLQPGDVFVQRHSFDSVLVEQARWVRIGAYWLDTMEMWQVVEADATSADAMLYLGLP